MDKLLQQLGLAMRAGRVVSGEEFVLKEIRSGKAWLVLLAVDAGRNTKKKIADKCSFYNVPLMRCGNREQLGKAIGKEERVVAAVTDQGFARLLMKSGSK
ncbi:YlxQ family RNA-binding protein [Thermoactinomyces mirandus]|uniref:YlxQ family RNA-binding protein n=1 Tax=Thermoactinomyces mirandus TaxID=2756294 RepID=A0A7W1XS18_9BACL|nr:YlxQ family RNA-binding protein [Thermoactinomyces mirandus]MBA4602085.1 YlxQ family RNA-binding protein [Thermoactinomyces mirandus]